MTPMRYYCLLVVLLVLSVFTSATAATNDIRFKQVLLPYPGDTTRYTYLDTLRLAARFINAGTAAQSDVTIRATIRWGTTDYVQERSARVTGTWLPGQERDVVFQPVTELFPPYYTIDFCAQLAGDEVPANDCSSPFGRDSVLIDWANEFQPAPLESYPASPVYNALYTTGDTIPMHLAIRNNGIIGDSTIPLLVQIRSSHDNKIVYARYALIDTIPGSSTRAIDLPSFIPGTSGRYCMTVVSNYNQEPTRFNDTLRWCFTVDTAVRRDVVYTGAEGFDRNVRRFVMRPTSVTAIFRNAGTDTLYNAPIRIRVYDSNASLVWMDTLHIGGPWAENTTSGVTFPFTATIPGRYRFLFCSELSGDEQPANDCSSSETFLYADFFRGFDIQAGRASLYPHSPLFDTTHYVGKPLDLTATFFNNGSEYRYDIPLHARIDGSFGAAVAAYDTIVSYIGIEGQQAIIRFGSFIPSSPGPYCVTVWSSDADDPIRANDTARWCFDIAWEFDIEAGSPALHPYSPLTDPPYPMQKPVEIRATFLNNGIQARNDVPLHVRIRDDQGTLLFLRDTVIGSIGALDSTMVRFGAFIPQAPGRYWVVTWSDDPDDPRRLNDTTQWSFTVTMTSGVEGEAEAESSMMLSLRPQPARGAAVAYYHLEHPATGTIMLYDGSGRLVEEVYAGILAREGEVAINVGGIPSGMYVLSLKTASGRGTTHRVMIVR
jgi:hypothetical protein